MTNDTEPRALGAALAAPAFVTRNHGVAMHTANRHVERWAPEADAGRVRSLHSLGFVDRLVAPWMETAQRSASLHLFSGYAAHGLNEGAGRRVSWVFPRPWYQDELDWMAAARQSSTQSVSRQVAPTLLTTRGTYVPSASAPASAPPVAMPSALYEHVAPSLSLAPSASASAGPGLNARLGAGFGAEAPSREAYSPLISLAAVQAAELMSRAVAPLATQRAGATATSVSPGLRSVLTTILERAAMSRGAEPQPLRISQSAPHLETPPSPRAADLPGAAAAGRESSSGSAASAEAAAAGSTAARVAQQYAEQRAQLAELQRFAQQSAQRDAAARAEAAAAAARTQAAEQAAAAPGRPTPADAQASARAAAQTAEVRAAAERAERELRQRAGSTRVSEAQRQAQAAEAERAAAERARIDERVAQRIAERTGAQRLHEQARADAAAHARALADVRSTSDGTDASPALAPASSASTPSADVAAAIAGLPPELSAMVGSAVNRRPERAMQAIAELGDALRTVELLARSSAAGAAFEAIRGPRLVMPAGLGGLVNAVDRAQTMTAGPVMFDEQRQLAPFGAAGPLAPSGQLVELGQPAFAPRAAARDLRVPTLSWLQAAAPARATASAAAMAGSSALGAATTASPAALSHVAWADRWLARFAGAAPQSLDMISAAGAATHSARMQSLANAAPGVVFVVPDFLRGDVVPRSAVSPATPPLASPASAASAPFVSASAADRPDLRLINPAPSEPVMRFDDAAETPDEVFAAISAAASRGRGAAGRRSETPGSAARAAQAAAQAEQAAQAAQAAQSGERARLADLVAHAAPAAPGAGLSAQLASSPFAPALRHVLPLPSAVSFDVRSLFGAGLGATYLAGLIGPALRELEIGAQTVPTWASWSEAPLNQPLGQPFGPLGGDPSYRLDRQIPAFDAAYVTPAPEASGFTEGEMSGASGERTAGMPATAAVPGATTPLVQGGFVPPPGGLGAAPGMAAEAATDRGAGTALTTLRSALLSWDLATSELGAPQLVPTSFAAAPVGTSGWSASSGAYRDASPQSSVTARMMIEAMSMPMLGETTEQPAAWGAPGMIADRAHTWSVAQERSASDLSLDFVTPELVLAARVYGLGPAEAAQAARLAIAGPGQLGAMASAVDRTFVEAMAIGREARTIEAARARAALGQDGGASRDAARAAITTAFPTGDGGIAAAIGPSAGLPAGAAGTVAGPVGAAGTIAGLPDAAAGMAGMSSTAAAGAGAGLSTAQPAFSNALFGVDRRAPRGAFLWPSSAVAALGMTALGSDGQLSMSVAALELLAAQVVAELGTYTALSEVDAATRAAAGELDGPGASGASPEMLGSRSGAALPGAFGAGTPMSSGVLGDASPGFGAPGSLGAASAAGVAARRDAGPLGLGVEPGEADVLGAAAALVPASRRARFDALYVALGQSTAGRSWSPAARAARALALAGRSDDTMTTARERAASAWDVLPVVYASGAGESSIDGAGGAAGSTAGSPAISAAVAAMMSSVVAPSAFGGSTGFGAARAQRGRGAGSRDVVGTDSGPGGWDEGADMPHVSAPGLAGLSARAGDALGAYVAPAAPPSAPVQQPSEAVGAVLRAPTAAPEYVQTGRSGGRHGGGEVEIPPWFEAAARRMLSERSGGDGISLAELTLVTAAPSSHIAAATISQPSTASASPPGGSTASGAPPPKIDIEKLAYELFRDIMVMMDVARARNGDPFQ